MSMHDIVIFLTAVVFGGAAVGKTVGWADFSSYLAESAGTRRFPPRMRSVFAGCVIGVEALIAVLVITGLGRPHSLYAAVTFCILSSSFLAAQYLEPAPRACECWGVGLPGRQTQSTPRILAALKPLEIIWEVNRPVLYSIRNSVISVVAVLAIGWPPRMSIVLFAAAAPACVMMIALVLSICIESKKLSQRVHPRYAVFAPMLAPLVVLDFYTD